MYASNRDGNSIVVDAQEWEELKTSNAILKDLNNKLIRAMNWMLRNSILLDDRLISDEILSTISRVSIGQLFATDEQRIIFCDRDTHEL